MGHRQKLFYYSGFSIEKKLIKLDSFFEKTKKEKFLKSLFQKLNKNDHIKRMNHKKCFIKCNIKSDSYIYRMNESDFMMNTFNMNHKICLQAKARENYGSNSDKNFEFIRQIKSKIDLLVPNKNKK